MKVLIACEYSGTVAAAFARLGHSVTSCDLRTNIHPAFGSFPNWIHFRGNVFSILSSHFDLMIAHPPCTYLSWVNNARKPTEDFLKNRSAALQFFIDLLNAPIEKIAVENPKGVTSHYRPANQIIYPYQFQEPRRKPVCLWLKNLPPLITSGRIALPNCGRWSNGKSKGDCERMTTREREMFFPGIATEMARQWGTLS